MTESPSDWSQQTQLSGAPGTNQSDFTFINPGAADGVDKQERDLAFAVTTIEEGFLTRKQLQQAVKDWTIHGDVPLAKHLVDKQLIETSARDRLEDTAETKLQRAFELVSSDGSSSLSVTESVIKRLDPYGKVAGVLGLSYRALADQKHQTRTVSARYQLMRKIGQGGLGIVWLAGDENLKRIVAIKEIVRQGGPDSPEIRRFRREAEITGRLEHPSIVPLYQFGIDERTEQPFYVMRYIGKRTLEHAIDEYHERRLAGEHCPMQLHYLLTCFVAVCQAIAYAHSKSVVHRDLKPENVALDSYGQVIVLDWGLAKLTGEMELVESCEAAASGTAAALHHTQDGQVLGTPMYMAPEQAAGRHDEIDERTDVYGLGAILFAILTGFAPHEKSRESLSSQSSMSELLRAIVSRPVMKARKLNPDAPPELEAICAKALSIKPYSRYASASDLAADIERWTAGEPVTAYVEPWRKRAARWVAGHWLLSRLAGVFLMTLLVSGLAFGVATQNAMQAERQARFATLQAEARQLTLKVETRAEELTKNVRFMSMVPPIDGIINTREGKVGEADDPEEIWVKRLQQIFTGLLGAHPNYVSVSFLSLESADEQWTGIELVRVERSLASGNLIRAVPTAKLSPIDNDLTLAKIGQLKPGEVYLEEISLEQSSTSSGQDASIVLGGIPIYSPNTGDLFGAVVIETDLETGLRTLLEGFVEGAADKVYVVNGENRVLLHYTAESGFQSSTRGQSCDCLPLTVQSYLNDKTAADEFTDGEKIVVRRIPFNSTRDSDWIALVLMLE